MGSRQPEIVVEDAKRAEPRAPSEGRAPNRSKSEGLFFVELHVPRLVPPPEIIWTVSPISASPALPLVTVSAPIFFATPPPAFSHHGIAQDPF